MNNNLPTEVKNNNIFKKIFNYIKTIFKKKTSNETIENSQESVIPKKKTKITELYKVENLDKLNADVIREANRKNKIEEIIQIIEKDPETLKRLDIPKLEVIDQYYKDKITECKKKLSEAQ